MSVGIKGEGPVARAEAPKGTMWSAHWSNQEIFVVQRDGYIYLTMAVGGVHFIQSQVLAAKPDLLVLPYALAMVQALSYTTGTNALVVGLGLGSLARYLRASEPQMSVTCVELDPNVIAACNRFLPDISRDVSIINADFFDAEVLGDGRQFDVIMLDSCFGGELVAPGTAHDVAQRLRRLTSAGGVIGINITPSAFDRDDLWHSLSGVFRSVVFLEAGGNYVCLAGDNLEPVRAVPDGGKLFEAFTYPSTPNSAVRGAHV